MGNEGCFPWGNPAVTESCYPTYGACWVLSFLSLSTQNFAISWHRYAQICFPSQALKELITTAPVLCLRRVALRSILRVRWRCAVDEFSAHTGSVLWCVFDPFKACRLNIQSEQCVCTSSRCGCSSVGHASDRHATEAGQFPGLAKDFSSRVNFQCRLSYGACTPPCAASRMQ